jgi:hypothetical protein
MLLFGRFWVPISASRLTVKGIPLQAWTDPEVSRRLRLLDFKMFGT